MAECGGNRTEGKDGVSLRFPRPVILTTAIGLAVAWTALSIIPAAADQVRQGEWWLSALHVTQAQQTSQGAGVTVALLDTGVDPTQPDLAGSVITGPDYTNSGEKLGSEFYGIHGTAMASLIVGHGHGPGDADGVLGVAPTAKLLSVRVALDAGDPLLADSGVVSGLPDAIAAGIRYAVDNGAQVIDLPLDPGQSVNDLVATPTPAPAPNTPLTPIEAAQQTAAGGSAAEQSAVAYALSKGAVLVAPGGDNGAGTDDPNFPADYPGVISVGAFDSGFIKAPFSSHQPYVTLTAAGSGMTAAIPTGYTTVSSTSAASAIVTGIVALIKSQYPELTPAQVTKALTTSTAFPGTGIADGSGHGTADAERALAAAKVIAGGGPSRADAGAVTRTQPGAPSVPFISQAMEPKIKRDGLISGALLVVLLVPIITYALVRRRRRNAKQALRPEHEPTMRAPYAAHSSDSQQDQMVQYFAAVPPQAENVSGPQAAAVGSARPAASRGPGYARGNGNFTGTFADSSPQASDDPARHLGQFSRSPMAPPRRTAARPPRVSGTPPWEPAPKPDTELPWAASAPPQLPRRAPIPLPAPASAPPAPASAPPAAEAAPAAAESLWTRASTGAAAPAADNGKTDGASEVAEPGIRPIYVWNPGANTETFEAFPSVPSRGPAAEAPGPAAEAGEAGEPEADQPPPEPAD
jgi:Subtilase family